MLLEDLLNELQWGSNIQKQDNQYYVELEHWSPLGEDVIDVIWFKEKTVESFLEALEEYKENIQERYMEDAELYIAERPRGTEEFSAKELIEDAEDKIKEFEEYYSKALQIVKGQKFDTYTITAHPYATQYGSILVPCDCKDVAKYIVDNWESIKFGEPELDYFGTDFESDFESLF